MPASLPHIDRAAIAAKLSASHIEHAQALAELAAPALRIIDTPATEPLPPGASRFGGSPDLPKGFEWPRRNGEPLTFLAQLDLSELQAPPLPEAGWLLFFYDAVEQPWGFDPAETGAARIMYVDGPREALAQTEHPAVDEMGGPFRLCGLSFAPAVDLPDPGDLAVMQHPTCDVALDETDAYRSIAARLSGAPEGGPYHHVLGHPQLEQNDVRGKCQLVTNGVYTGSSEGQDWQRVHELLADAWQWRLLLQIDSDWGEGPGWMWGDAGKLYFCIREEDLAARAFDQAWCVLQCG